MARSVKFPPPQATTAVRAQIAAKQQKVSDTRAALDADFKRWEDLRESFPEGWKPGISSGLSGTGFDVTFHLTEKQIESLAKMLWKARSVLEDKVSGKG